MLPPTIVRRQLLLGVDLWMVPVAGCPFVTIELGLPLGASTEPAPGLAGAVERALQRPPAGSIAEGALLDLEQVGVNILSQVMWSCCNWTLPVQSRHLFHALTCLGQFLLSPCFDDHACQQIAEEQIRQIDETLQDDSAVAALALARMTRQPDIAGNAVTLGLGDGFTTADLQAYAAAGVTAKGARLVLAGGLAPDETAALCEAAFSAWPQHAPPEPRRFRVLTDKQIWCRTHGTTARVVVAVDLAHAMSHARCASPILAQLLEDHLHYELRTRRALGYYVRSYAAGTMVIAEATVDPASAQEAFKGLDEAFAWLNHLRPETIRKAARLALFNDAVSFESTVEIAGRLFSEASIAQATAPPDWTDRWTWLQTLVSGDAALALHDLDRLPRWRVLVSPRPAGQSSVWKAVLPEALL